MEKISAEQVRVYCYRQRLFEKKKKKQHKGAQKKKRGEILGRYISYHPEM